MADSDIREASAQINTDPPALEIGKRYLSLRSDTWNLSGTPNRWLVYSEPTGYNGAGGYWINEHWTWQNNGKTHHVDIRSLSYEKSRELERRVAVLAAEAA